MHPQSPYTQSPYTQSPYAQSPYAQQPYGNADPYGPQPAHPQQVPYGQQVPRGAQPPYSPQVPYGVQGQMPPQPGFGYPWAPGMPHQPFPGSPRPSGITASTAAVLGLLVGLAWLVGIVVTISVGSPDEPFAYVAAGFFVLVLAVPQLIGSLGMLARKRFGRVLLIVGASVSMLPCGFVFGLHGFVEPAPTGVLAYFTSIFAFSAAALVLASLSTTGRYIRAAGDFRYPVG